MSKLPPFPLYANYHGIIQRGARGILDFNEFTHAIFDELKTANGLDIAGKKVLIEGLGALLSEEFQTVNPFLEQTQSNIQFFDYLIALKQQTARQNELLFISNLPNYRARTKFTFTDGQENYHDRMGKDGVCELVVYNIEQMYQLYRTLLPAFLQRKDFYFPRDDNPFQLQKSNSEETYVLQKASTLFEYQLTINPHPGERFAGTSRLIIDTIQRICTQYFGNSMADPATDKKRYHTLKLIK